MSILKQLSAAELKEVKMALKAQAEKEAEDRKAYKELVNENIPVIFEELQAASDHLKEVKVRTFRALQELIRMKADVFERNQDQFTHSFTTDKGITLIVGHRVTDNWDDTVTAGLQKMNDYLSGLIEDEKTSMLVGFIRDLLTRDQKGNLSSKNVLKLRKKADEVGDETFIDAVRIIMDSWKPIKGATFVTCRYKDPNTGDTTELPLDISSAKLELPEDLTQIKL